MSVKNTRFDMCQDVDHVLKIGREFAAKDGYRGAHYDTVKLLCDTIEHLRESVGNAVVMREAMGNVLDYIDKWLEEGSMEYWQYSQLFDICDAAIAKPPRNCDMFDTKNKSREAFQKLRGHRVWADVSLWDDRDEIEAYLDWLFTINKGEINAGK